MIQRFRLGEWTLLSKLHKSIAGLSYFLNSAGVCDEGLVDAEISIEFMAISSLQAVYSYYFQSLPIILGR